MTGPTYLSGFPPQALYPGQCPTIVSTIPRNIRPRASAARMIITGRMLGRYLDIIPTNRAGGILVGFLLSIKKMDCGVVETCYILKQSENIQVHPE